MIEWVLKGAKQSKLLSEVLVATDDELIRKSVQDAGGVAVMTESSLPSGTDRIQQALRGRAADLVVNIQGDEPLIRGEMIDALIEPLLKDPELEMSTLAHQMDTADLTNLNAVKVILNHQDEAIYFSRFAIPHSREFPAAGSAVCLRHLGLYGYRREFLEKFCKTEPVALEREESLEQLRALWLGARIKVVRTSQRSWGVDTPEDLERVEKLGSLS